MTPADTPPRLGPFDIGCVVIGGIIGVGIFFAPASVAGVVDSSTQMLVAWAIGGVIALLGALTFADLASRVPGHGGTFRYIEAAFGAPLAFLFGWANWLVIQAGALGVIGTIFADNLVMATTGSPPTGEHARVWIAIAAILAFTALNLCGLRVGNRTQNAITVLKVLIVFGLVVLIAIVAGPESSADSRSPGANATAGAQRGWLGALTAAMLPVLFSFGGWQQGSFLAGAARRPRDVAWGIVGGVLVVVVAYLALNAAYLSVLGREGAATAGKTIAATATRYALEPYGIGDGAARVVAGMVAISALGILNTVCLAPPYVLKAMAERGLFFAGFARLHSQFHCPSHAILGQGLWGAVLLCITHFVFGLDTLAFLLDGVVFVDWIFFGLAGFALVRLQPTTHSAFSLPAGRTIPMTFGLVATAVTIGAIVVSPAASGCGLVVCLLGIPAYARFQNAQSRRGG